MPLFKISQDPHDRLGLTFTAFFTILQHTYLAWAQQVLGNRWDAEAAVQNAGSTIHRKWDTLLTHAHYEALAFKIVHDCVCDFRPTPQRLAVGQQTRPTDQELLVRAIRELAQSEPLQADCLRLSIAQLSLDTIGRTLGTAATSADLLLHRARTTVQRLITDSQTHSLQLEAPSLDAILHIAAQDLNRLLANHDVQAFNLRMAQRLATENDPAFTGRHKL